MKITASAKEVLDSRTGDDDFIVIGEFYNSRAALKFIMDHIDRLAPKDDRATHCLAEFLPSDFGFNPKKAESYANAKRKYMRHNAESWKSWMKDKGMRDDARMGDGASKKYYEDAVFQCLFDRGINLTGISVAPADQDAEFMAEHLPAVKKRMEDINRSAMLLAKGIWESDPNARIIVFIGLGHTSDTTVVKGDERTVYEGIDTLLKKVTKVDGSQRQGFSVNVHDPELCEDKDLFKGISLETASNANGYTKYAVADAAVTVDHPDFLLFMPTLGPLEKPYKKENMETLFALGELSLDAMKDASKRRSTFVSAVAPAQVTPSEGGGAAGGGSVSEEKEKARKARKAKARKAKKARQEAKREAKRQAEEKAEIEAQAMRAFAGRYQDLHAVSEGGSVAEGESNAEESLPVYILEAKTESVATSDSIASVQQAISEEAEAEVEVGAAESGSVSVSEVEKEPSATPTDALSQYKLAENYRLGKNDVDQSDKEAVRWYYKAAQQGYPLALSKLGDMYAQGLGVAKSIPNAAYVFLAAAQQGNAEARTRYNDIMKEMVQDDDLTKQYKELLLNKGVSKAQFEEIIVAYKELVNSDGEVEQCAQVATENDVSDSIASVQQAISEEAEAEVEVGAAESGSVSVSEVEKEPSATPTDALSQYKLAENYRLGKNDVDQSDKEAVIWYSKAAEQGHPLALSKLGDMLAQGLGVEKSIPNAAYVFLHAAKQGNAEAGTRFNEVFETIVQDEDLTKQCKKLFMSKGISEDKFEKFLDKQKKLVKSDGEVEQCAQVAAENDVSDSIASVQQTASDEAAVALPTLHHSDTVGDYVFFVFLEGYNYLKSCEYDKAIKKLKLAEKCHYVPAYIALFRLYDQMIKDEAVCSDDIKKERERYKGLADSNFEWYCEEERRALKRDNELDCKPEPNQLSELEQYRAYTNAVEIAKGALAHSAAQMGTCYYYGLGIEVNHAEAVKYYTQAKKLCDSISIMDLADCYMTGTGVDVNRRYALELYKEAADMGCNFAKKNMNRFARISANHCTVTEVQEKLSATSEGGGAAEGGSVDVEEAVLDYQAGYRFFKSCHYVKAVECLERAAKAKYPPAYILLFRMYKKGNVLLSKDEKAVKINDYEKLVESCIGWYRDKAKDDDAQTPAPAPAPAPAQAQVSVQARAQAQELVQARAQMALCYRYGVGVEQDYKKAAMHYLPAAERGDEVSQTDLADCFFYGAADIDTANPFKFAVFWYKEAANKGYALAQNNLGSLYDKGLGVNQNFKTAALLYKKAADQGLPIALNNYAGYCAEGLGGVPKNMKKALKYFEHAISLGSLKAKASLGKYNQITALDDDLASQSAKLGMEAGIYESRFQEVLVGFKQFVEALDPTGRDIREAKSKYQKGHECFTSCRYGKAITYLERAADLKYKPAYILLHMIYQKKYGPPGTDNQAGLKRYERLVKLNIYWYRHQAEDISQAQAQAQMAWCYYFGIGVEQSFEEAAARYSHAAELGDVISQNELAECYRLGHGKNMNYKSAGYWYLQAAEERYGLAQNNMGAMYEFGYGIPKNFEEAVKWYSLAAKQEHPMALNNYARFLSDGKGGVEKDMLLALKYYNSAFELGCEGAKAGVEGCRQAIAQDDDLASQYIKSCVQDGIDESEAKETLAGWSQLGKGDAEVEQCAQVAAEEADSEVTQVGLGM